MAYPRSYAVALVLGVAAFLLGATIAPLGWVALVAGVWALYSAASKDKRWMAWTGLGLGLLVSLINLSQSLGVDGQSLSIPEPSIAHDVMMDDEASLGIERQEFSTNWAGLVPTPRNGLGDPEKRLTRGAVVYEFEDTTVGGSTLWVVEDASSSVEYVVLTHDQATTPFADFMVRWDALCRSLGVDGADLANCSEVTMSGLGVGSDPRLEVWQQDFESRFLYGDQCWQLSVFAPVNEYLRLSTRLRVDAAADPSSVCRHPDGDSAP